MDPYQSPEPTTQYDFILNPDKAQKPKGLKNIGSNNKFIVILGAIIGGIIVLMIIVTVLLNVLVPSKVGTKELTSLSQSQNELIRVSKQGTASAVQQTTKNLATTVQYSVLTQQKETLNILAQNGVEVSPEQLALKQNATTDQRFANAKSTSTYDVTFTAILEQLLRSYSQELKRLSELTTNSNERNRLSEYYQQTQLLISQIPFTEDKLESD